MKRRAWKWIFGISLTLLILLVLFTIVLWGLANAAGVLLRLLFILDEDMEISMMPFSVFMSNFVGSPLFYIYIADLATLVPSAVALAVTKKR